VIDSAPTSIETGHGVQLHATVSNELSGVTWSVNGVDGGTARLGTITPGGFYTAPSRVPAPGHVTIAARSASGAHDQRVVAIALARMPLPSPGTVDPGKPRGSLLGPIATVLNGHVLAAGVTPARAGLVSIRAHAGKHRLGACSAKTPRGRRFTCRLNIRPGLGLGKLRVVAKLMRGHAVLATVRRAGPPPRRR
jgi:hypothetical protein